MDTLIRAVVFDLDGVLVDAREWHYLALNRALAPHGFRISRREHLAAYDGLPTRRKLEKLSQESGLPRRLHDSISDAKQIYTMEAVLQKCRPNPQHLLTLRRLRMEGYRLAVASNSVRATVEAVLDKTGLAGCLEFHLSNQDVAVPKPDPEIYRMAAGRLGLAASCCLVVEDNVNGVTAARAAGCPVLTVTGVRDVCYDRIRSHIRLLEDSC